MIYWPKNGYRDNSRILMDNSYSIYVLIWGGDTILYPLLINHFVPLINRQIWSSSTRLRQECPFYVLSRLVSKVVPEFWEAGSGQVPCTHIRGDGAGQSAAARGEQSPQQCHSRLTSSAGQEEQEQRWKGIIHEEKGKEHNVSLDKQ